MESKNILIMLKAEGTNENPMLQIEGMPAMTLANAAQWLWEHSITPKRPERPISREPRGIWKAELASPQEHKDMSERKIGRASCRERVLRLV